jgi:methylenetetrahydrofolate reductase (NADPH)
MTNAGKISPKIIGVPEFSFEFFPTKSEDALAKLKVTIANLAKFLPEYFSVTYGAGGSTRDKTFELVKYIKENTKIPPAAHLTCVGAKTSETDEIARQYLKTGVNRIVALRGDVPGFSGKYQPLNGGYAYADSLVKGLLEIGDFDISVAAYPEGHPQANSIEADIEHLKRKQDAGAARAITQYCFNTETILRFVEKARNSGITIPIVAGILTINSFEQTLSFSKRCGATVPEAIKKLYQGVASQSESDDISTKIALEQCQKLMQNDINQFHFYSLNRHEVASQVCRILTKL